jgi:glutamate transport system substrate-binding protein
VGSAASGAAGSVAQITGSGSGEIDKATYDGVIASAPKADDATVEANPWAKAIKERGVLRTGGSETGQLFSLLDLETGKVVGFDAGLSQMLAQYILGEPNTELTVTTVDTRETLIQNGTVDGVFATYSITPARAEKVAFAGPYFVSGDSIAVRKDNTDITSVADLAGKTVTTQTNSTALTALQDQAPNATLQPYTDDAQCQAALTQGRADAYVLDQSILIGDAIANPDIKVVGEPFTVDPYGIGITKDDPSAKEFVNAWLKTIEDDGLWADLWKATIGTVVEGDAPAPPAIGSVPGS